MPSPEAADGRDGEPHHQRQAAESFGSDPERYDRARPRYPDVLIERIVAGAPGRHVLDAGLGTGIVARQFQAAGCKVLGVEPDARMAEFAQRGGVDVEVSTFEAWEAAGREFDAVVSGESWHWVDPVAGAAKAAEVLGPGGRLAVFWITGRPSEGVDETFAGVYRRALPESLVARLATRSIAEAHLTMCTKAADGMRATGAFDEPEQGRDRCRRGDLHDELRHVRRHRGAALAGQAQGQRHVVPSLQRQLSRGAALGSAFATEYGARLRIPR